MEIVEPQIAIATQDDYEDIRNFILDHFYPQDPLYIALGLRKVDVEHGRALASVLLST